MPAIANEYPDEIVALRDGIGTLVQRVVVPMHEKHHALLENHGYGPDGRYKPEVLDLMTEIRQRSAEAGYYTMCVPEDLGGGGLGYLAYFAGHERLFHLCGAKYWLGAWVISHWARGPSPILSTLHPQTLAEVSEDLMSGKTTICFGLSEPEAGSDAAMIKTRATRDGDGWRINGAKIWTTNSPYADYAVIFAVTDPELAEQRRGGISAFFVPTNAPGFQVQRLIHMWGHTGGDEAQIALDDVRVEPHQLIGELDKGFAIAMYGAGLGRMFNCGRAIGIGRWALEMGLDYVKVRKTFGKPLSEYQGVTFPLADSALELHAGHLVSRNAAELLDAGHRAQKELSFAKIAAIEAACNTVDRVMQVHGAMGFTNELHLTEAYASLRKIRVADGASEIMRRQVVKHMLGGDLEI